MHDEMYHGMPNQKEHRRPTMSGVDVDVDV
jgi:hypothetical protein